MTSQTDLTQQPIPPNSAYADLNGLRLYYEVSGKGSPLFLLPGGMGSTKMFSKIIPTLSEGRQVVAVDLQAHGRTADIDRPLSFEVLADDIAALAEHLGFHRVDVMGYSMSGGIALQVAARRPDLVRKVVLVSFPFERNGWHNDIRAGMDQVRSESASSMIGSPPHAEYMAVAPKPEDWPKLVGRVGDLMRLPFDWRDLVSALTAPVLLVYGDADFMSPGHAAEFFALLGGGLKDGKWDGSGMSRSALAVLPRQTHYTIFACPLLPVVACTFLDERAPTGS